MVARQPAPAGRMRIVVIPPTLNCTNLGDLALMSVAVRRLSALWPDATIRILTRDPVALKIHCPGARPLEFESKCFEDGFVFGRMRRFVPQFLTAEASRHAPESLSRRIAFLGPLIRYRLKSRTYRDSLSPFLDALHSADLVFACGAGGFNDEFPAYTSMFLTAFSLALGAGKPCAALSQGIGPVARPALVSQAKAVFPRLFLAGTRESRLGPALLRSFGVSSRNIVVTGDDAIELALAARPSGPRTAIGVNLRTGISAGVDPSIAAVLKPPLQDFAQARCAPLLALPVAQKAAADSYSIQLLLDGYPGSTESGFAIDSADSLIARTSRCRMVVTGAYHAAVFALAQGIPALCLAGSAYFAEKFRGLAAMFGQGVFLADLTAADSMPLFRHLLDQAWTQSEQLNGPLRQAADAQAASNRAAYRRLFLDCSRASAGLVLN